jgi:pyridoxal phosphate enzyme (YggS family)
MRSPTDEPTLTDPTPNIAAIRRRIIAAATQCGRSPGSVRLVAVSKRQPASAVRAAYACGVRDFGENYVQELIAKAQEVADLTDITWHMIGHLQTNKARLLAPVVSVVHTLDSTSLPAELARRAARAQRRIQVLVEVNVANDPAKTGCTGGDLASIVQAVQRCPELDLRGLMTMPPYSDDSAETRRHFATLRTLQRLHGGAAVLPELSMGMSHDFEVAIEEGATIVRVGTAIFGARSAPAVSARR